MARIKVWYPMGQNDLPATLRLALQAANRESKRNWAVCQQVVVDDNAASQAEILRLREQVRNMERVIERLKKGGSVPITDVYSQVKEAVMKGQTIGCLKSQWPQYREALQRVASWAIDNKQAVYANIALNEVRRLDRVFEYHVGGRTDE